MIGGKNIPVHDKNSIANGINNQGIGHIICEKKVLALYNNEVNMQADQLNTYAPIYPLQHMHVQIFTNTIYAIY